MLKVIRFFGVIFLLLSSLSSLAQQDGTSKGLLEGTVLDGESGVPMEYATIQVYDASGSDLLEGAVTDMNGRFEIPLAPAHYQLRITFIGFEKLIIDSVHLMNLKPLDIGVIRLGTGNVNLQEIEIIEERSQMQLKLDKRVFNVGTDLSNTGTDALNLLSNVPSVTVDVEGNVSLRGSENVQILIDGKPSGLLDAGNTDALRFLQSNMIEKVEVVTNPSAKYDAEGEVGIINLVLKKERNKGVNGSLTGTVGYPNDYGLTGQINYRKGNMNWFGSAGTNFRQNPGMSSIYQESYLGHTTMIYESERDHVRGGVGFLVRTGMDITIKETNTLTISGMYRMAWADNEADIVYRDLDQELNLVTLSNRIDNEREDKLNLELDLNYRKSFEGKDHFLTVDAKWVKSDDTEISDIEQNNITDGTNLIQSVYNEEDERMYLLQTDYNRPFQSGLKLETGLKSSIRLIKNPYSVEEQINGEWQVLDGLEDEFGFREEIYAAYGMLSQSFGRLEGQLGLRSEWTRIYTESKIDDYSRLRDYIDWFPTLHITFKINESQSLQWSYSRRISRPGFRHLLPFSNFSDNRNYWVGNPNLNPEYTHSAEIGYLVYWEKGSILNSIYFRHRTGVVDRITIVQDDGTGFSQPVNLSREEAAGGEISLNHRWFDWWNMNLSINLYGFRTVGSYEGMDLSANGFSANGRIGNMWKIPGNVQLQANYMYDAPRNDGQGRRQSMSGLDLSLGWNFLKNNATLTFSARDVFNTRRRRSIMDTPEFYREMDFQWRSRVFSLSFSYRFNKQVKGNGRGGDIGGNDILDF